MYIFHGILLQFIREKIIAIRTKMAHRLEKFGAPLEGFHIQHGLLSHYCQSP